jgi:hypothetical protein
MSAPLTYHTLTTYHSHTHRCQSHLPITHSPPITHTLTHVSPTYLSHAHRLPLTHNLPLIHSPISVPVTTHTITHTHHLPLTHTYPCRPHLLITYSPLITHTLTYISPTYHSHNYPCQPHLSLIKSFVENDVLCFFEYVLVFRRNLVPLLPWNTWAEGRGSFLSDISAYRGRRAVTGNNIQSRISLFQNWKSIPPCFQLKLFLAGISMDSRSLFHVGKKYWAKWHWYRFFSEHFDALRPAPFRHSSIFGYI